MFVIFENRYYYIRWRMPSEKVWKQSSEKSLDSNSWKNVSYENGHWQLSFKNHVDKWYKVHCNPYHSEELKIMLNHYFLTSKNTVIFPLLSQILSSLKVSIFCPLRYQFCSLHTTMFIVGRQAYRVGQNIKLLFLKFWKFKMSR